MTGGIGMGGMGMGAAPAPPVVDPHLNFEIKSGMGKGIYAINTN